MFNWLKDLWKDGPIKAYQNSQEDQKSNSLGRWLAKKYPNDSFESANLKHNRNKLKK